jgi:hypothetical protein
MANEKALLDFFAKIESDVNGVIAAAVVDLESGMTLAAKTNRPEFDLAAASAYNSELVKQKMKIMRTLNLKSTLEDMLITLSDQFHLIKFLPGGTSFLYLAADRSSTNLAILRNFGQQARAGVVVDRPRIPGHRAPLGVNEHSGHLEHSILERVVVIRIVYDGAPMAGKSTSVRALGRGLGGEVVTPAEVSGRTLYFDWLDYTGGLFEGRRIRCQIISVPGQATLAPRRRRLLESADVIVFVGDSTPAGFAADRSYLNGVQLGVGAYRRSAGRYGFPGEQARPRRSRAAWRPSARCCRSWACASAWSSPLPPKAPGFAKPSCSRSGWPWIGCAT